MSPNKLSNWAKQAATFCKVKDNVELAKLLNISQPALLLLSHSPEYNIFEIPKPNGKLRLIEEPDEQLKEVLKQLNYFLQLVYYFNKPTAAYGFILSHKTDLEPRNILTNAEKHIGAQYLLNIDMQDFFHFVSWQKVYELLMIKPFHFAHDIAVLMANLCCYNGRLPMGSPTSPVLSNFAAYKLDAEMMAFCSKHSFIYSRFVDDMSFSSKLQAILPEQFTVMENVIATNGFAINPNKIKWFGASDTKEITGLQLTSTGVIIPSNFFEQLGVDLLRLQHICEVMYGLEGEVNITWLNTFKQSVEGRIAFVEFVYGQRNKKYLSLKRQYNKSMQAAHKEEVMHWLDLPYGFFT